VARLHRVSTTHDGRTLVAFVELKTARGRLTKDQESVIAEMTALGVPVHVCRSYKAATDAIANELYL
jgi:VRR-NUC domain